MAQLYRGCALGLVATSPAWAAAAVRVDTDATHTAAAYVASLRGALADGAVLCGGPFTGYEAWIARILANARVHVALNLLDMGTLPVASFDADALAAHVCALAAQEESCPWPSDSGQAPIAWLEPPLAINASALRALPPNMRTTATMSKLPRHVLVLSTPTDGDDCTLVAV